MTRNTIRQSGISKNQQPDIVVCPKLLPFSSVSEINGLFCYIIEHYGSDGLIVLIDRDNRNDDLKIIYGDWSGNKIDINIDSRNSRSAFYFHEHHLCEFVEVMRYARIPIAQFCLAIGSSDLILTDIATNNQKFTGPGMVRDVFGKIIMTQNVRKTEIIDQKVIDAIDRGFGSYSGDLIIKPSKFHTVERINQKTQPLYVEIRR